MERRTLHSKQLEFRSGQLEQPSIGNSRSREQSPSRAGRFGNEVFPQNESWWQPTDTREEWAAPVKKTGVRNSPDNQNKACKEIKCDMNEVVTKEAKKPEEETCEIVVHSTKRYLCGTVTMNTGTITIEEKCFIPIAKVPLNIYINCGPADSDRFETLEKYCKDDFHDGNNEESNDENDSGLLRKIKTKTVERIGDGKYEERTEHKYTFPKSAKITFLVAMHSQDNLVRA